MHMYKITFAIGQQLMKECYDIEAQCPIYALQQFIRDMMFSQYFDYMDIWDISIEEV